jgi:G3E family GTPase
MSTSAPLWRSAEEPLDVAALHPHDLFALAGKSDKARQWFAEEVGVHHHHDTRPELNRHGEAMLRVKGILNIAGSETPVAVHGLQHLVHPPVHMAAWPDEDRSSRLVFIVDGLDSMVIERSLAAFLGIAARMGGERPETIRASSVQVAEAGF